MPKLGRLLQSYAGNGVRGNALVPTSFICPDILPTGTDLLTPEKYATTDAYGKVMKIEDRALSTIHIPIDHSHSKILVSGYTTLFDKQFMFYPEPSSSSSSFHGLSGISEPGCALSLLSSRSPNSSIHSSGFPMARSLNGAAEPENHHRQIPISDCNDSINFEGSEQTISLSQLSSRLQCVETQRQSLQS